MELFNVRCIDGLRADEREPISFVQAEDAITAAEMIRGFKLTESDMLAMPCVEVWPVGEPYSKERFYRIR